MRLRHRILALLLTVAAGACSDSISPDRSEGYPLLFSIKPASSISANEHEALGRAFDKVDQYRVIVRDSLTRETIVDTLIHVPLGLTSHTLDISIPASAIGRILTLEIIAFQGDTELFRTETEATVEEGDEQSIDVSVRYTGPGLRGSVADAAGGGVGGVTVELRRDGASLEDAVTAADGSFLFIDLLSGDYVVRPTLSGGLLGCPG